MEKIRTPKQIYARLRKAGSSDAYIEARETADEFDEEGNLGRYELVEEGKITIANSFVAKERGK